MQMRIKEHIDKCVEETGNLKRRNTFNYTEINTSKFINYKKNYPMKIHVL